jgi:hypothetical protein
MQGREVGASDIGLIRDLLAAHPDWNRTRLSRELCTRWDWRNAQGRAKDMAARTLLLKLERAGYVRLPARRGPSPNGCRNRQVEPVAPPDQPIRGALRDLQPLSVRVVDPGSAEARLFHGLLAHEHYLGHRNTVGENLRYLVRDRHGRPVACALFGSAAWKCADRDAFLGWDHPTRERNLQCLANNTRFLIPTGSRFLKGYERIVKAGYDQNPAAAPTPGPQRRGRRKQSKARNLLDRFRDHPDEILAFMRDFAVPFDNNQSERDLRIMKLRQKISGTFRSIQALVNFCRIRGYVSTAHKNGLNALDALQRVFLDHPFVPTPNTS